jgi:hypothetical protein
MVMFIGVLGTVMVGFSQTNKEGNPTYFQKTWAKWSRLTLFYVVAIVFGLLALIIYIVK